MSAEEAAIPQAGDVSVLPPCTQRQRAFAARRALGDTMAGACRYAGCDRSTGYVWEDLPQVQQEIARYGRIAADHARRMLVGQVRSAVRTLRNLNLHAESEAVRLNAAKLILDYLKIGELPVGSTQSRIISRIPRGDGPPADDTMDEIEARYQHEDIPTVPTADGLPPDFARTEGEQGRYAQPERTLPQELTDPAYYRRSMYDRE